MDKLPHAKPIAPGELVPLSDNLVVRLKTISGRRFLLTWDDTPGCGRGLSDERNLRKLRMLRQEDADDEEISRGWSDTV